MPWQRRLLLACGIISLGLGLIGIPLPLLPTTPFLLLSAWCFARSSERFYQWLLNHRYFGKSIRNYRMKGGVSLGVKIGAITLLWLTILFSVIFVVNLWWVRGLLLAIAIGVTIHIWALKTIRAEENEA
ncbi:MAG: YbaN family protein [Bacteroidales bacterium]|nr:YbaN family protein [Bacteroidales bacterium]NLM92225.1 DUF454 domain-containing protein [Bacteroidales bacterium]